MVRVQSRRMQLRAVFSGEVHPAQLTQKLTDEAAVARVNLLAKVDTHALALLRRGKALLHAAQPAQGLPKQ